MRPSLVVYAVLAFGCSSSSGGSFDEGDGSAEAGAPKDGGGGGAKADAPNAAGGAPVSISYSDAISVTPPALWLLVTNNLAGMPSECGNAAAIYSSPWVDMLITGVARHGLFASNDGGATWVSIGNGGPSTILNRMTVILFDPIMPGVFWESGIYGWESPWTEGVFITMDNGNGFTGYSFMGSEKQSANDSISVDFTDPNRQTMLSGGHEQSSGGSQGLFLSKDGGQMFDDIMSTLPAGLGFCTRTLVLTSQELLVGCASAIMRSSDQASSWTKVSDKGVGEQPLFASDGAIYWPAQSGGLLKSTDQGVTFSVLTDGATAGGRPIELPDKRIAATASSGVVVSADGGATWKTVTKPFPAQADSIAYSPFRRAFYASHGDCGNSVPGGAYAVYGWDYTAN